jgi:hypothetical protein
MDLPARISRLSPQKRAEIDAWAPSTKDRSAVTVTSAGLPAKMKAPAAPGHSPQLRAGDDDRA